MKKASDVTGILITLYTQCYIRIYIIRIQNQAIYTVYHLDILKVMVIIVCFDHSNN